MASPSEWARQLVDVPQPPLPASSTWGRTLILIPAPSIPIPSLWARALVNLKITSHLYVYRDGRPRRLRPHLYLDGQILDPDSQPPASPSTPTLPAGVTLRPLPGGGPEFWAQFEGSSYPADPAFFPIIAWYQGARSVQEVQVMRDAGINTLMALTTDSRGDYIRQVPGMYSIPDYSAMYQNPGSEVVMYLTGDEPDMGPPNGWWGAPSAEQMQHVLDRQAGAPSDRPTATNFGKGILFCFLSKEADASSMLGIPTGMLGYDVYYHTDDNVRGANEGGALIGITRDMTPDEIGRSHHYGMSIEKLRRLSQDRVPIFGFVEAGGPFSYNEAPDLIEAGDDTKVPYITIPAMLSAAWHTIIAGARGIAWFLHTFGGIGETTQILHQSYYAPVREAITQFNSRVHELASVLNRPEAIGLVSTSGHVRHSSRWTPEGIYLMAGWAVPVTMQPNPNPPPGPVTATFTVAGKTSAVVEVLYESRTLQMSAGSFTDVFADKHAIHLYRIPH
ncbi:MAG: hypothetical protein QM708_12010 [Propioniciclava sp.]|uniref:hypothetical protein n=1 Tax=Propioniciclava sp. TaxID=2038686 RepID=UPI0039E6B329